jgi:hypothetical protein
MRAMPEKAPLPARPWADSRADFAGETKEGNKHLSSRLYRLCKINKVLLIVRLRRVLRAGVTRSNRAPSSTNYLSGPESIAENSDLEQAAARGSIGTSLALRRL